jgi:DNA-directed RNA polymerase specialized sigma24 family protein
MPDPLDEVRRMTDPLQEVRRAAQARQRASHRYAAAVLEAVRAGWSFAAVAESAGVSRQAVRQLVRRSRDRQ